MPNTFNLNSFLPISQYKLYSYERPRAGFLNASDFFWRRKSLFFQIDNEVEDGEKILIKTEFIKNLSHNQSMLLGMGLPSNMPHEPSKTSLNTINFKTIFIIQIQILKAIFSRIIHNIKFLLNDKTKRNIQKIFKKKIKVNSN